MKIEKIVTKQAHSVPSTVTRPKGPFPPEILAESKVIYDYNRQADNGQEDVPIEGTAQNNFKETKWFRCNLCELLIAESQLETHICEA
jgi:hypothetical protein